MAHFAKLDENGAVLEVLVLENSESGGGDVLDEEIGIESLYKSGFTGIFKQTSYNGKFRKNYAVVGGIYDPVRDAFIGKQDFPSWILNMETLRWEAPIPHPMDGNGWVWNESYERWDMFMDRGF